MEKRGSGLRKICKETSKLPGFTESKEPRFRYQASSFYTELPNNNYQAEKSDSANEPVNEPVKLSLLQKDLLENIRLNARITRVELVERLNVSLITVKRTIAQLKELGLLERVGSDKSGHWTVRDSKERKA